MFIAILDFSTAAADRPAALAQLDSERGQVRGMQGNIAFRVYAGREDDTQVTVVHEWQDETSFTQYLGSASFARSGAASDHGRRAGKPAFPRRTGGDGALTPAPP